MMKVVLSGDKKAQAVMKRISVKAPMMIGAAMYTEGELTMTLAKSLCPVDTGRLRDSGRVGLPHMSGGRVEIELGFHTDYAIYVHEDLNARHPVGQAKFLEAAVNYRRSAIESGLARALAKAMK